MVVDYADLGGNKTAEYFCGLLFSHIKKKTKKTVARFRSFGINNVPGFERNKEESNYQLIWKLNNKFGAKLVKYSAAVFL